MADVGLVDAGLETVRGRNLLSTGGPLRPRGIPDAAGAHRAGVEGGPRQDCGIERGGAEASRRIVGSEAVGRAGRIGACKRIPAVPAQFRFEAWGIWRGAQIPAAGDAQFSIAVL